MLSFPIEIPLLRSMELKIFLVFWGPYFHSDFCNLTAIFVIPSPLLHRRGTFFTSRWTKIRLAFPETRNVKDVKFWKRRLQESRERILLPSRWKKCPGDAVMAMELQKSRWDYKNRSESKEKIGVYFIANAETSTDETLIPLLAIQDVIFLSF